MDATAALRGPIGLDPVCWEMRRLHRPADRPIRTRMFDKTKTTTTMLLLWRRRSNDPQACAHGAARRAVGVAAANTIVLQAQYTNINVVITAGCSFLSVGL
jgi:hypothetical protein